MGKKLTLAQARKLERMFDRYFSSVSKTQEYCYNTLKDRTFPFRGMQCKIEYVSAESMAEQQVDIVCRGADGKEHREGASPWEISESLEAGN